MNLGLHWARIVLDSRLDAERIGAMNLCNPFHLLLVL